LPAKTGVGMNEDGFESMIARQPQSQTVSLYAMGFYLLAIVFLSPHAGCWEGMSFFKVAQLSPWDRWWDWAAAWCSLKIILLSLGIFSLIIAIGMLLKAFRRESLAKGILLLCAAPILGFWLGVYYLFKALL
jgi:hypothetical protein